MTDSILVTQSHAIQGTGAPQWLLSDLELIESWLYGVSDTTRNYYKRYAGWLLGFLEGKPLALVDLTDLQAFDHAIKERGLADSSRHTALSAIKSLFGFAVTEDKLERNPSLRLKLPKVKNTLAERILPEADVVLLLRMETNRRNRLIIKVLYGGGLRVSEACGLKWRDLQPSGEAGQMTIFGKGGKTRIILLPPALWQELLTLRGKRFQVDNPIFCSRKKAGHLTRQQVYTLVRAAGKRIDRDGVSPHWLRHCHASHALDRGAPISLVQQTLGHSSINITAKYLHAKPSASSAQFLLL